MKIIIIIIIVIILKKLKLLNKGVIKPSIVAAIIKNNTLVNILSNFIYKSYNIK